MATKQLGFYVTAIYQGGINTKLDRQIEAIAKKHKAEFDGCGCFIDGERDLGFIVIGETRAKALSKAFSKVKGVTDCFYFDQEDDD